MVISEYPIPAVGGCVTEDRKKGLLEMDSSTVFVMPTDVCKQKVKNQTVESMMPASEANEGMLYL